MDGEQLVSNKNYIYVENNKLYSKYGDIFLTSDFRCLFVCIECDHDFEFFEDFMEHVGMEHDFHVIFQNSTIKRLVCISNVVDKFIKDGKEESVVEDTKELIEYKEEENSQEEKEILTIQDSFTKDVTSEILNNHLSQSTQNEETFVSEMRTKMNQFSINESDLQPVDHLCDMCGKKFANEKNLVRHKWRHSSQTQWSCPTCGKVTTTKDGMILHVRRKHTGEKPFKCKFCDKTFASASQRNLHHRTHTGYKPYICDKCGKAFKLHTVLRYHIDWHMGIKNYKCELCDKRFHSTSELNNHKSVHTWERPFVCSNCDLRFKTKRHLQRHKEVHSGKLKMCKYCDKGFAHISTFTSHLRLHQLDEVERSKNINVPTKNTK